jgi:hypothetical protein
MEFNWKTLQIYLTPKPGAFIIKLITAVIYGFRNKLECLSLNPRLGWKGLPGTNKLTTETVNYGCNKFYNTGPRGLYYKSIADP